MLYTTERLQIKKKRTAGYIYDAPSLGILEMLLPDRYVAYYPPCFNIGGTSPGAVRLLYNNTYK